MLGPYRWFEFRSARIQDDEVQILDTGVQMYAGMFGPFVRSMSMKGSFLIVPRNAEGQIIKKMPLNKFDGLSLSSINRPYSRLGRLVPGESKSRVEQGFNPVALITDPVRATNTFLTQMPVVRLSDRRLRMFHASKLSIEWPEKISNEFFGIPAVTVFMDKGHQSDEVLRKITGQPLSFEGDGFVVSRKFIDSIEYLEFDDNKPVAFKKLKTPVKMQGLARSKGITTGFFDGLEVTIPEFQVTMPVDVLMNTQGKRLNKVANLSLSAMRLRKYLGQQMPAIRSADFEWLQSHDWNQYLVTGYIHVAGVEYKVLVGINKFYIDLTHRMSPKVAKASLHYVQAQEIYQLENFVPATRYYKEPVNDKLAVMNAGVQKLIDLMDNQFESVFKSGRIERKELPAQDDISVMAWLYQKTGDEFFRMMAEVSACNKVNGIRVLTDTLAEELRSLESVKIWAPDSVIELPVIGKALTWNVTLENLITMDETLFEYDTSEITVPAATELLASLIKVNCQSVKLAGSFVETYAQKIMENLENFIGQLAASYLKLSARIEQDSKVFWSVRARHVTVSDSVMHVNLRAFERLIRNPAKVSSLMVVWNDVAYVSMENQKNTAETLKYFDVPASKIVPVSNEELSAIAARFMRTYGVKDAVLGMVARHPITGYVAVGEIVPDECVGIGVPAQVAQLLDGDDDGDTADLVPLILAKGYNKTARKFSHVVNTSVDNMCEPRIMPVSESEESI